MWHSAPKNVQSATFMTIPRPAQGPIPAPARRPTREITWRIRPSWRIRYPQGSQMLRVTRILRAKSACSYTPGHGEVTETREAPGSAPALLAGLGAGDRASRRRPPGLAPGTHRPGQPADEPPGRLGQLGVAHVDLALLARGLGPLGLVDHVPRVHLGSPFPEVLAER